MRGCGCCWRGRGRRRRRRRLQRLSGGRPAVRQLHGCRPALARRHGRQAAGRRHRQAGGVAQRRRATGAVRLRGPRRPHVAAAAAALQAGRLPAQRPRRDARRHAWLRRRPLRRAGPWRWRPQERVLWRGGRRRGAARRAALPAGVLAQQGRGAVVAVRLRQVDRGPALGVFQGRVGAAAGQRTRSEAAAERQRLDVLAARLRVMRWRRRQGVLALAAATPITC